MSIYIECTFPVDVHAYHRENDHIRSSRTCLNRNEGFLGRDDNWIRGMSDYASAPLFVDAAQNMTETHQREQVMKSKNQVSPSTDVSTADTEKFAFAILTFTSVAIDCRAILLNLGNDYSDCGSENPRRRDRVEVLANPSVVQVHRRSLAAGRGLLIRSDQRLT